MVRKRTVFEGAPSLTDRLLPKGFLWVAGFGGAETPKTRCSLRRLGLSISVCCCPQPLIFALSLSLSCAPCLPTADVQRELVFSFWRREFLLVPVPAGTEPQVQRVAPVELALITTPIGATPLQ